MDVILKYICMPLAINTIKHNRKEHEQLKIPAPYLNLDDAMIKQLEKDFLQLKQDMYSKHRLDVRKVSGNLYTINKEEREFSSKELRAGTKQIIQSYMYGDNMIDIEHKEIPLEPRYTPPDVDSEDNR